MRKAIGDRPRVLVLGLVEHLEDSDFAADNGILSHSRKDIQEKNDLVDGTASTFGLKIHPANTKLVKVKVQNTQEIKRTLSNKTEQDKTCKFSM